METATEIPAGVVSQVKIQSNQEPRRDTYTHTHTFGEIYTHTHHLPITTTNVKTSHGFALPLYYTSDVKIWLLWAALCYLIDPYEDSHGDAEQHSSSDHNSQQDPILLYSARSIITVTRRCQFGWWF